MITNKTKYAIKALYRLALARPGEPMLIVEIAELEQIPKKFLELILVELKQHGILESRKGRGGGYLLAKPAEQISVADILRITDGPLAPVPCLSRTSRESCTTCKDETTCPIRLAFQQAYGVYVTRLEQTSLRDLVERVDTQLVDHPIPLRYSI
jgi:Rrf2 family protein